MDVLSYIKNYEMKFRDSVMLALLFHLALFLLLSLKIDKSEPEIPFRIINIRFGTEERIPAEIPDPDQLHPQASEKKIMEDNHDSKIMEKKPDNTMQNTVKERKAETAATIKKEELSGIRVDPVPKKPSFKKRVSVISAETSGSQLGNRINKGKTTIDSYEQLISLWIEKHKIYPEKARKHGIEGVVTIRLWIKSNGEILKYELYRKSGHYILDDAASVIMESSNPVPPLPEGYSDREIEEFYIPIRFVLDTNSAP